MCYEKIILLFYKVKRMEDENSPKPKRLKQYVIVKEYYGTEEEEDSTQPEKKRRYIEKTI